MKRQLIVEVNCGETTCAPCGWQGGEIGLTGDVRACWRFALSEIRRCKDGLFHRCRSCLAAEAKARKGGGR